MVGEGSLACFRVGLSGLCAMDPGAQENREAGPIGPGLSRL